MASTNLISGSQSSPNVDKLKTTVVTSYNISRTVQRTGWLPWQYHKEFCIMMTFLCRFTVPRRELTIAGLKFITILEEETYDAITHERLYAITVEQVGYSTKRFNKHKFQYTDIEIG